MASIKLARVWELGAKLAAGGFGQIYEATADDGSPAVVKLVPKAPGADRELLFEELSGHPNIVPILDSGEWKNSYALVMPRADKSLAQHLKDAGGKLAADEAVKVLADVAEALASLEADVVHRDLKPANILFYDGHWCLADFGIARYAEATTDPDTHKFAWTPPYAAPEQWRGERATNATDVYAFGVMAFEMLQGQLPFPGIDFRREHLTEPAPPVTGVAPTLASLINECLIKAAPARPTAANILARLRSSRTPPSPAAAALQDANRAVSLKRSEEAARLSAEQTLLEHRGELLKAAKQSLDQIVALLEQSVLEAAPHTELTRTGVDLVLQLADGRLIVDHVASAPPACLDVPGYESTLDVIGYSAIAAKKDRDRDGYEGRAHSLWFCDAQDEGTYRWYELAFMLASSRGQFQLTPAALAPTTPNAREALSPSAGVCQLAWEPLPFDQGDEAQFIERWLDWFAKAVNGSLTLPRYMPETSGGRHRSARRERV
jgi:prepilin-type processing-associated H-X9-DG protein